MYKKAYKFVAKRDIFGHFSKLGAMPEEDETLSSLC